MGETTPKEEIGKYGSVNGTQSKPSPSAEKPHHHHHHYPLFPGILYLAAFVVIYSGRLSSIVNPYVSRESRVIIACVSASFLLV
jgi:hypothetical protein